MYAAAGGASLASRQARQKQRQNKKAQLQKNQKPSDLLQRPQQKTQFHNYTDHGMPKLSRVERNALRPPIVNDRRHSTSNYLKEPSRARIRESPSICIPVQNHLNQKEPAQPLTPCTLVQNTLPIPHSPSIQSQLPQITIPEGDKSLERRCSFVRQVEEMEKSQEGGVLDRCNHICNFEIQEKSWDKNPAFYAEYDRSVFGSLDYPFSECSQGRAAWQERERGRRGSLSDEARQHRLKQSDAHHRWMKRNRIHDTTYGGSTDDEEMFNVYHQSAAANALLYVGLGTIAIGSVIFFVGTGEKGFKTLELRLIGPTLIACGLLCCLIRVLLCACPSKCVRGRKKTRLKNSCPHNNSRYPLSRKRDRRKDFVPVEKASLMHHNNHKKVSIATANNNNAIPSTSTMNFQEPAIYVEEETQQQHHHQHQGSPLKPPIPLISVPDFVDFNSDAAKRISRENSIIELQNLEIAYDLQSISSCDSDTVIEVETAKVTPQTRIVKSRESRGVGIGRTTSSSEYVETCLSVVIEKRDLDDDISVASDMERVTKNNRNNGDGDVVIKVNEISDYMTIKTSKDNGGNDSEKQRNNSEIVLSPLQLGQ